MLTNFIHLLQLYFFIVQKNLDKLLKLCFVGLY